MVRMVKSSLVRSGPTLEMPPCHGGTVRFHGHFYKLRIKRDASIMKLSDYRYRYHVLYYP